MCPFCARIRIASCCSIGTWASTSGALKFGTCSTNLAQVLRWVDCSGAMPEPARKREREQLIQVLNGARLSEDLVKYLIGLGLSSVSDFLGLVTTAGYESELKTQVLDLSPAKDDVLQLSRLRAAWREGSLLLEKARKRRLEGVLEDADEPLDARTHDDLLSQWKSTYQLQLPIHAMPSDTLLGRVYREFQRGAPTLIPAKQMQSLFRGTLPSSKEEVNLGSAIKVQSAAEPVIAYYQALRVLANAYAIAGGHMVESVSAPEKSSLCSTGHEPQLL